MVVKREVGVPAFAEVDPLLISLSSMRSSTIISYLFAVLFGALSVFFRFRLTSSPKMAAYGSIETPKPTGKLPILSFNLPAQKTLLTFPLTLEATPPELRQLMFEIFRDEIDK